MNLLDRSVLQSFVDDIDDSTFEKAYDNILIIYSGVEDKNIDKSLFNVFITCTSY